MPVTPATRSVPTRTFKIVSVLADGKGVLLQRTCVLCDADGNMILCPACHLSYCARPCWQQHVESAADEHLRRITDAI